MERYEVYKDSGIEWIGEIPEGWAYPIPAKRVVLSRKNGNWGEEPSEEADGKFCLRAADFDYDKLSFKPQDTFVKRQYSADVFDTIRLSEGDLLVEKSGGGEKVPVGRAILYRGGFETGYSNFMERIRVDCEKACPSYFFYWWTSCYQSGRFMPFFSQTTGIQNLNSSALLSESLIAMPSLLEQRAIADFLDEKTAEIDGIVSETERSIELLREYRKSVISEAVTKGLDPDAPMKDSGVEWIGEIPEGWTVSRIKEIASLKTGHTPPSDRAEYFYGEETWFTPGDINNGVLGRSSRAVSREAVENGLVPIYPPSSTLLVVIGGTAGKVGFSEGPSSSNQQITAISPDGVNGKWLFYAMLNERERLFDLALFTTLPIINNEYLGNRLLCIPSSAEQYEIVDCLDAKTAEIDALIADKERQVELLKEYRKSLISEAVTGKFKVPGVK